MLWFMFQLTLEQKHVNGFEIMGRWESILSIIMKHCFVPIDGLLSPGCMVLMTDDTNVVKRRKWIIVDTGYHRYFNTHIPLVRSISAIVFYPWDYFCVAA